MRPRVRISRKHGCNHLAELEFTRRASGADYLLPERGVVDIVL